MSSTNTDAKTPPMRAGGRATEAGMHFQASVATWLAVHILARLPVGGRFGISNTAVPTVIRLETGNELDDIELTQDDGGVLCFQCKTDASLSTQVDSPLAKTGKQLVSWLVRTKANGAAPDPIRSAAVLAVRSDAAATLDELESACRAFDLGGSWSVTESQRNLAERTGLKALKAIVSDPWKTHCGKLPTDSDLVDLARIFHINRFSMGEGHADWREASKLLGRHLYGSDAAGDAPLRDLLGIMRKLIGNGAPADRIGLLNALRLKGHIDTGSPRFESDVAKLRAESNAQMKQLAHHCMLSVGSGVTIKRESGIPLATAMASGSLLVVGEPGAGKTGALVNAATELVAAGAFVVFLSVDQFSGIAKSADLDEELHLEHPLIDVLAAAPGPGPKYCIIDALDAARGGHAETVFARLIEQIRTKLTEEWIVIASIRTFDLRNGHRYRELFTGTPADLAYADTSLKTIRHFMVPPLSDVDIANAGKASPEIAVLLKAATPSLVQLLRNVYNLSLATELLAGGAKPADIAQIGTQATLIDIYEDLRIPTSGMQRAAKEVAAEMVRSGQLVIRKVDVNHPEIDRVIQSGLLSTNGDLVWFAHHILFDHVAGRFLLDWNNPDTLAEQLKGNTASALMLAPALRFTVEQLWRIDAPGKNKCWKFVCGLFTEDGGDVVLANVALRILCENVREIVDIGGLDTLIRKGANTLAMSKSLRQLSRFVALSTNRPMDAKRAVIWGNLAEKLTVTGNLHYMEPARALLFSIGEEADWSDQEVLGPFGRAARTMLKVAWADLPRLQPLAGIAITFVAKSFGSDPRASKSLLEQILCEPHFSKYADQEANLLAREILTIARVDPAFAAQIYAALNLQNISDTTTTALGGNQSRIMLLLSTRKQDFQLSRSLLTKSIREFLEISAYHGTRAVIDTVIGQSMSEGFKSNRRMNLGNAEVELLGHSFEFVPWDSGTDDKTPPRNDEVLPRYMDFLQICSAASFRASIAAATDGYSTAFVWARILFVASQRVAEIGDTVWPLMTTPDLLELSTTSRHAAKFIVAAWKSRTEQERRNFEAMLRDDTRFTDVDPAEEEENKKHWQRIAGHLLSQIPEALLVQEETREIRRRFMSEERPLEQAGTNDFAPRIGGLAAAERERLRRDGVDMIAGPNRPILDASDALHEKVQAAKGVSDDSTLASLWADAADLVTKLDASPALDSRVDQAAWGHVSNAVELVATYQNYQPGKDGLPDLEMMLSMLTRLSASKYPLVKEDSDTSYRNCAVRIYAASAWVSLAPKFGVTRPEIVEQFNKILSDSHPGVRMQAAAYLDAIYTADPGQMWAMGERIATSERHKRVLLRYLDSLLRFSNSEPERCEHILSLIVQRIHEITNDDVNGRHIHECLGAWLGQLYVVLGRPIAESWLEEWASNPIRFENVLFGYASWLKDALFFRYREGGSPDSRAMSDRGQQGLALVIKHSSDISQKMRAALASNLPEEEKQATIQAYTAAEKVIDHAMSQLYIGSGAAKIESQNPGLNSVECMANFIVDYESILAMLRRSRQPKTLHQLIQLYEYLIPGDPDAVFSAIHEILTGSGAEEGYQFESMGEDVVVNVVGQYIADYRTIFEDPEGKKKLVEILGVFSDAGSLKAASMLYELPDLLR